MDSVYLPFNVDFITYGFAGYNGTRDTPLHALLKPEFIIKYLQLSLQITAKKCLTDLLDIMCRESD